MRKHEYPHNEPAQVRAYIEDALDLVAELDPPEDLRVAAFTKACDLLASKQVILEQTGIASAPLAARLGI